MKKLILLTFCILFSMKSHAEVSAISDFDTSKYLGKWHEIARLPNFFEEQCVKAVTAHYSLDPEREGKLVVVNECQSAQGEVDIAKGEAYLVAEPNIGKLKVTFLPAFLRWTHIGYGDYWVLSVDYEVFALVGSPDRKYLWILSRSSQIDKKVLDSVILTAKNQGFDTDKLIFNEDTIK